MSAIPLLSRNVTTFTRDGAFDEDAYRRFLQRFIDSNLGIYVASGGSGEGHALTHDELKRVYRAAVETCKGKVPVFANPPEQHTARATLEHSRLAVDAGVDGVNVYGPAPWHGYRSNDQELVAYYDLLLPQIGAPVALAPNPVMAHIPTPELLASIANKHRNVVAINLSGLGEDYFLKLKQQVRDDVGIYVPLRGSIATLGLGAAGMLGAEANIVPKSYRRYMDLYQAGDFAEATRLYAQLLAFSDYVAAWMPSTPRWQKMAMHVFKLPGWEGGLREPYRMPPPDVLDKFADGLLRLGIPELNEQAQAAGWSARG